MRAFLRWQRPAAVSAVEGDFVRSSGTSVGAAWRSGRQTIILAILLLALGTLVAANLQSKAKAPVTADEYPRQLTAATIERLEADQSDLKRRIAELRKTIADRQEQAAAAKTTLTGINAALEQQKIAAGLTGLKGPGLRVVLDDSSTKAIPAGDDPSFYIVHEYQLRDVVNLLWAAGAEALAVNGERIVSTTSIYCVGSTILINNTRLSAPYEIVAIGDPQALEDGLSNPANLKSLKARAKAYGLQLHSAKQRELGVLPFDGSLVIKYGSAGSR